MNTRRSTRRMHRQDSTGRTCSRGRRSTGTRRMTDRRGRARAGLVFHRSRHPRTLGLAETPTAVAAAVPSPHGGPCRTASQREHQEGGEEEDWQPTVSMSCGAGHGTDQRQLPCRPPGGRDRQKALSFRASRLGFPLAMPNDDDHISALADMSSAQAVGRSMPSIRDWSVVRVSVRTSERPVDPVQRAANRPAPRRVERGRAGKGRT